MTKEDFAKQIDGFEYPGRELQEHAKAAKEHGLVIAYGQSDDLLEFGGAMHDELSAWNGTDVPLHAGGLVPVECDVDNCPHERRKRAAAPHWVRAEWCPEDNKELSWRITASVPTATFRIVEDGEVYCEGIVFEFAALADSHSPTAADEGKERQECDYQELKQLFELQHRRTAEADKAWQDAHGKPDIMPDLGELIAWLMEKAGLESHDLTDNTRRSNMSKEKMDELTALAKPLIKYLNDKHHPHMKIIITPTSVELLEGVLCNPTITEYIKD